MLRWLEPKYMVPGFFVAALAVLNIGIVRGDSSVRQFVDLQESRDVLAKSVQGLEDENERIEGEIGKLKESPDYARKVLKDKYHVTTDNEKIIFFAN